MWHTPPGWQATLDDGYNASRHVSLAADPRNLSEGETGFGDRVLQDRPRNLLRSFLADLHQTVA